MADSYFPRWRAQPDAVARGASSAANERLAWPQMFAMGIQHVVAMFGSTVLAPLLMGFDPNLCIFHVGHRQRCLFFVLVGGPRAELSRLELRVHRSRDRGHGYGGHGPNMNVPVVALGGIIACGVVYAVIGLIVSAIGTRWIETADAASRDRRDCLRDRFESRADYRARREGSSNFDSWMALVTVLRCVGGGAPCLAAACSQRLLILVGLLMAYVIYAIGRAGNSAWASQSTSRSLPTPRGSACRIPPRPCSTCRP